MNQQSPWAGVLVILVIIFSLSGMASRNEEVERLQREQAHQRAELQRLHEQQREMTSAFSRALDLVANRDGVADLKIVLFVVLGVLAVLLSIFVIGVFRYLHRLMEMTFSMNRDLQGMRYQLRDNNRQIIDALHSVEDNRQAPPRLRALPPAPFPPSDRKALKP